jgi:hypothetical protein
VRDPHRRGGAGIRHLIHRRGFLAGCAALALWPLARLSARAGEAPAQATTPAASGDLAADTRSALETSDYVYVSPLRSDGDESTCHGEVWYGWFDGSVVIITSANTWKARSASQDLDRARIWVGNHGRWKGLVGRNEEFRKAPSFDARAEIVKDDALLDRLLALYETKYPDEIARWRDRMRQGYADGTRVLIRYRPV